MEAFLFGKIENIHPGTASIVPFQTPLLFLLGKKGPLAHQIQTSEREVLKVDGLWVPLTILGWWWWMSLFRFWHGVRLPGCGSIWWAFLWPFHPQVSPKRWGTASGKVSSHFLPTPSAKASFKVHVKSCFSATLPTVLYQTAMTVPGVW